LTLSQTEFKQLTQLQQSLGITVNKTVSVSDFTSTMIGYPMPVKLAAGSTLNNKPTASTCTGRKI